MLPKNRNYVGRCLNILGCLSVYRNELLCHARMLGLMTNPEESPCECGDDRRLTSYILRCSEYYIDNQERAWKVQYYWSGLYCSGPPTAVSQFITQNIRRKKDWFCAAIFNIAFFSNIVLPASRCTFLETALACLISIIIHRALIVRPVQGDYWDALVYTSGIIFVGLSNGLDFSIRHNDTKMWPSRILISFLGSFLLHLLFYYAILTIRDESWLNG